MLFNADMDRRLSDLNDALATGGSIKAQFHPAFEHSQTRQPDRLHVDIVGSARRLVFDVPTSAALADQLTASGYGDAAGVIRAAIPEA